MSSNSTSSPTIPLPVLPTGQVLLMVFSWISFILYAILIYVLVTKKKQFPMLNSPFYTIVIYNSIGDFAMFFHVEILMRPRKFRFFDLFSEATPLWLGYFSYSVLLLLRNVMYLGFIPLALNRFTAFFSPVKHKKFWSTYGIRVITVSIWIFSAIITAPGFFIQKMNLRFTLLPDGILQMWGGNITMFDSFQSVAVTVIVVCTCIPLYEIAALTASRSKSVRKQLPFAGTEAVNLFAVHLSSALMESLRSAYQLHGTLASPPDLTIVKNTTEIWFYLIEIMTSVRCWTLFVMTPRVRLVLVDIVTQRSPEIVFSLRTEQSSIMDNTASARAQSRATV